MIFKTCTIRSPVYNMPPRKCCLRGSTSVPTSHDHQGKCCVLAAGFLLGRCKGCRPAEGTVVFANHPCALLAVAPICFDQVCQNEADTSFLLGLALPALAGVLLLAYLWRPLPSDDQDESIFSDPNTGIVFEGQEGAKPEHDDKGELVWKAISYTPWPVAEGEDGERIRIDVGPVGKREPRTFVFKKSLNQPSEIITCSLPRPLGVEFEEDKRARQAIVGKLIDGGHAKQKYNVAQIDRSLLTSVVMEGDVLRAMTCTNFVYPTNALLGVNPPERHIVVFGADGQTWPNVAGAMMKGDCDDGEVTLVLERPVQQD